jgi:hypothetical protein
MSQPLLEANFCKYSFVESKKSFSLTWISFNLTQLLFEIDIRFLDCTQAENPGVFNVFVKFWVGGSLCWQTFQGRVHPLMFHSIFVKKCFEKSTVLFLFAAVTDVFEGDLSQKSHQFVIPFDRQSY